MDPNTVKAHKITVFFFWKSNHNKLTLIPTPFSQGLAFLISVLSAAALWWQALLSFVARSLYQLGGFQRAKLRRSTHYFEVLGPQSERCESSCFCSQTALVYDMRPPLRARLRRAWTMFCEAADAYQHLTFAGALARYRAGSGICQAREWFTLTPRYRSGASAVLILSSYRSLS